MGIEDYSTTAADNTDVSGVPGTEIGEGTALVKAMNNAIRQVMADVRSGVANKGADIASASSIDLGAATGQFVDITGDATITSLGTVAAGVERLVRFTGAGTITHNATSLILPKGSEITRADGDVARFVSLGSGNWLCTNYLKGDGTSFITEMGRNLLANGTFDMWDNGTSFAPDSDTAIETANRWFASIPAGAFAVSRQEFTLGQTDVPGNPRYFLRSSGAGGIRVLEARMADVRRLSGKEVTASLFEKGIPATTFNVELVQNFGTGGSPSAEVVTSLGQIPGTTDWQKFTFTGTAPSIAGKTLGNDDNSYTALRFFVNADVDDEFNIAMVQLEEGPVATEFDRRHLSLEEVLARGGPLVIGPASAADGDFAGFDGTSGRLLKSLGAGIDVGTWTPRLIGSTSDGDYSYSEQEGHYARCGPLVLMVGWMVVSAVNSAGNGQLRVTDLPFSMTGAGFLMPGMVNRITSPASVPSNFAGWIVTGATTATIQIRYQRSDTAEIANVNIQDIVQVGTDIRIAALAIL